MREHSLNWFICLQQMNGYHIHFYSMALEMWFWLQICQIQIQLGDWYLEHSGKYHYGDVIMSAMTSQITSLTIVYSTVYSGADQRKHQSSASLVFVQGIHRSPVNSPHKWPVTRKMFPFDDVSILSWIERQRTLLMVNRQCFLLLPDNSRTIVSLSPNWSYT